MNKIRWALVGAGDIAQKRVAPAISLEPHSRLDAIVDLDAARGKAMALAFHCNKTFQRLEDALADSAIDAVYLATPIFLHAEQTLAVLKAGKHVLCEKPLGLTYLQAQRAAAFKAPQGKTAAVAYYRRFYPKYQQAQNMLSSGAFGQVVMVRLAYHTWCNIPASDPKYWRMIKEKSGGGVISDMGCHMFDVMIGLLGLPESVFARVETMSFDYAVEDSAAMVMKYRNGPLVTASFNWNSKTWTQEFEIIGTEAKIRWHPYDSAKVTRTVGREVQELDLPNHENVHYPLIADFTAAILEGRSPATPLAEAVKTNLLMDAVYQSSAQGREIRLEEVAS